MKPRVAKLLLILTMLIYGTIGLFVRKVNLPGATVALVRGVVGGLILLPVLSLQKSKAAESAGVPKKEWVLLALAGALIGLNWMLLFEAYNHMSVAVATLINYLAPVFVILLSPIVLGVRPPKLSLLLCIPALIGMVPISGVLSTGVKTDAAGFLMALGSAVCYAAAVLINKKVLSVPTFQRTVLQLFAAAAVVLPYVLLTGGLKPLFSMSGEALLYLAVICILHTGIAYAMYFAALPYTAPQDSSLLSYLDPVVAILLSALVLKESFGWPELLGTVLILGAAVANELFSGKTKAAA